MNDITGSRRMTACMHIWTNDSRIHGSGRIQCAYHRSSRKKTAVSRMWKKKQKISLWKKSMEFPIRSHLKLTSAWRGYIISQVATSLWSGGDNSMPGKQLNPQYPVPQQQCNSYIIICRMKKNMEQLIPDWSRRADQSIQKSSVFQYTTGFEGSSYSSATETIQLQE